MSFQSFHFLIFFLTVLFFSRVVFARRDWAKKDFLLVASYYFYMCWDWRFSLLILAITIINFIVGPRIANAETIREKRWWLGISLVTSLGILGYFKYANFFIESMDTLLSSMGLHVDLPLLNVVLPVGISFYTFQSISYTLDIYRHRTEPVTSFRDFALFVAFFPQLVAGPIVRASHFLPQLGPDHQEAENCVEDGFALIIRGFVKKVALADVLALHIVDPAFADPAAYSSAFLIVAIYAYSYQVYMDFSGYTDIARGVAKTLGYELQINFDRPYKAISVSNFWQRWHISMSSFFRDYLYFGVGGSKYGNVYVNLMITFVAIGVWHGAGWNFVVYGICHGAYVGLERWRRERRKSKGLPERKYSGFGLVWQVFFIFNVVSFTRILFRGGSLQGAGEYLRAMTDFSSSGFPVSIVGGSALLLCVLFHYTPSGWTFGWKKIYSKLPAVAQAGLMVATIYVLIALSSGQPPFIYFQF